MKNNSLVKVNNSINMHKSFVVFSAVIFGVITITLSSLLAIFVSSSNTYKTQLENVYQKSLYELVNNVNSLELNISKLVATTNDKTQSTILNDVYQICGLANNNISSLPISNNKIDNITSFINRLGGYSYSLLLKLDSDEQINITDFENIESLHKQSLILLYDLNTFVNNVSGSIVDSIDFSNENLSEFGGDIINVESENSQVPSLIYDGPFSDSVLNKEVLGLVGSEISQNEAYDILRNYFGEEYEIRHISNTDGKFATYNFRVSSDSKYLYPQIAKTGGLLLNMSSYGTGGEHSLSKEEAIVKGKEFLSSFGFENMENVWSTNNGNIAYINFAPIINGVIYYPDLVKVKVDLAFGEVIGIDATNYAYNHTMRDEFSYGLSIEECEEFLSPILEVVQKNIALIPNQFVGESISYEYICTWSEYVYYIYLDVNTGKELNIMRLISTTSGDLIL